MNEQDHDLLIRIDEKVDTLTLRFDSLENTTAKRVDTLERDKLDLKDSYPVLYKKNSDAIHNDHEQRIRVLETWLWRGLGIVSAATVIINLIFVIYKK